MKKYLYLMVFLVIGQQLTAQTQRVYVTKSGDLTTNSNKGSSYLVVKQLDDTTFLSLQYDMHNKLMSKGIYKDAFLTIPNGKFTYYNIQKDNQNAEVSNVSYIESNNNSHISSAGYFKNGVRTGMWRDFSGDGQVSSEYFYANNVLNGPYKTYTSYPDSYGEGTMVNGKLDGKFKYYNNGLLVSEFTYANGKISDKKIYLKPAVERRNLQWYLESKLYRYAKVMYDSKFTLKYTVTKEGKITNAQIIDGYDADINKAILDAVTGFDGYDPAMYNNAPVEQQYTRIISIYSINDRQPKEINLVTHGLNYESSGPVPGKF